MTGRMPYEPYRCRRRLGRGRHVAEITSQPTFSNIFFFTCKFMFFTDDASPFPVLFDAAAAVWKVLRCLVSRPCAPPLPWIVSFVCSIKCLFHLQKMFKLQVCFFFCALFLARHSSGIDIFTFSPSQKSSLELVSSQTISSSEISGFKYNHSGDLFALAKTASICIYDAEKLEEIAIIPNLESIVDFFFSPKDTMLCVMCRFVNETAKNLKIYAIKRNAAPKIVFECAQKVHNLWKPQFCANDTLFARFEGAANGAGGRKVGFYAVNAAASENEMTVAKVCTSPFEVNSFLLMSVGADTKFSCFVKTTGKGAAVPCQIKVFNFPNFAGPIAQKSLFRVDRVDFICPAAHTPSNNMLVVAHADHDATGQSYYGESALYFVSCKGNFDCRVDFEKKGLLHDASWNTRPDSNEFVAISGAMPSVAAIFDTKCNVVHSFGENSRNIVKFNANGSLFLLGGFGNLPGYVVRLFVAVLL